MNTQPEIQGNPGHGNSSSQPSNTLNPKTWHTSHLPKLPGKELRVLLDIMYCWYNQQQLNFPKECNWPLLWEYIDRHGLSGITGSLVLDDLADLPLEFDQAATHRYFSNQLYYEQAIKCCDSIQKAAKKLNIPAVVLKGPAIVSQGYKDPGTRAFCDIDMFSNGPESVHRLADELGSPLFKDSAKQSYLEKLSEPECIGFRLDNWDIEFRYPLDPPGEPMFEVLAGNSATLFKVPQQPEGILSPDPSVHLVFLLQHMAIQHLFSRFFWFLDLTVFVREQRTHIDFDFVEHELDRIGLRNSMNMASTFCRQHIDPDFPTVPPRLPAWNYSIMKQLIEPVNIANGKFGVQHRGLWRRSLAYIYAFVCFFLVDDPKNSASRLGFGTTWTLNRLKNSYGLSYSNRVIDFLLGSYIKLWLYPFARCVAWLICLKSKNK